MADITIADVRSKYPQYKDMGDQQLADALHKKYYADMPADTFYQKIGLKNAPAAKPAEQPSMLDQFGRQVGLTTRYAAEMLGEPITDAADLLAKAMRYTEPDFSGVPGIKKQPPLPSTTRTFESGLTALGLPEPKPGIEKGVEAVTKAAPLIATGAYALGKPVAQAARILTGSAARKAGEAAREKTMQLTEQELTGRAAEKASLPDAYTAVQKVVQPVAGRDVPVDVMSNVKGYAQDFKQAYGAQRDQLKDVWQQQSRIQAATGNTFDKSQPAQSFKSALDKMEAKYRNDPSVVRTLKSMRESVFGTKEPSSFDAIETAQQKIAAQATDPMTAAVPNLSLDFKRLSESLNTAMGEYAPAYGKMLKQWPDIAQRREVLQGLESFANKYGSKLEKISPTSETDPKEALRESRNILVEMKNDRLIDEQTKTAYLRAIDNAEKEYGKTAHARKIASVLTFAAAVSIWENKGWWAARIGHVFTGAGP